MNYYFLSTGDKFQTLLYINSKTFCVPHCPLAACFITLFIKINVINERKEINKKFILLLIDYFYYYVSYTVCLT